MNIKMMGIADELEHAGALPSVGVMLATYNGERFVGEQIDSILAQRGVMPTIYVRDDEIERRGTLAVVRAITEAHPGASCDGFCGADAVRRRGNFLSMVVSMARHTPILPFRTKTTSGCPINCRVLLYSQGRPARRAMPSTSPPFRRPRAANG